MKRAVLLVVFAMLWLSFGSLVNFHQHRLYGKILLSELVACTPQKKSVSSSEYQKALKAYDSGFSQDHTGTDLQNTLVNTMFRCLILEAWSVIHIYTAESMQATGLRAPPVL